MKLIALILFLVAAQAAQAADCPSKPQNIKIIDLKSGWWQGDGGDTDQYVIRHIQARCPDVKFFYEHTLYGGFGGGFGGNVSTNGQTAPAPTEFHLIWLLSGGEADGADLRINDPKYLEYQGLMIGSRGNLFIGTGFGNVYHANSVTSELGLGQLAITNREVHEYPSPSSGLTIVNEIQVGGHPLFENITTLPHVLKIGEFEAPSDKVAGGPQVTALATDAEGNTVIGEVKVNQRKMIIDANLARTYLIREANPAIQNYLLNLVKVLEN